MRANFDQISASSRVWPRLSIYSRRTSCPKTARLGEECSATGPYPCLCTKNIVPRPFQGTGLTSTPYAQLNRTISRIRIRVGTLVTGCTRPAHTFGSEHTYTRADGGNTVYSRFPSPRTAQCARSFTLTIGISLLTKYTTIVIAFAHARPSRAPHAITVLATTLFRLICIRGCIHAEPPLNTITRDLRIIINNINNNDASRVVRTTPHTASDTRLAHPRARGRAFTGAFSRARRNTLNAWG
jgi:hypothetical protein